MTRKSIWIGAGLIFLAVFIIDREIGMMVGSLLIVCVGSWLCWDKVWAWPLSMAISWTWVYLGRDLYSGYNTFQVLFMGVSIFPILIWPTMLMLFYFWFYPLIRSKTWWGKWLKLSTLYSLILIIFETLGYNLAGVHLDKGRAYHGWPILNIFHCPWWMQMAYFANGIVFCGIVCLITYRYKPEDYLQPEESMNAALDNS